MAGSDGKKPRGRGKRAAQAQAQGHYADPMSPIASTPMKRQRTKSAENAKSAKAKHLPQAEARGTPVKSKEDERFLSPRKLDKEFDKSEAKDQTPVAVAAASNGKPSEQGEEHPSGAETGEVDQVMFSPTLKPPKCSRSVSASPTRQLVRQESHGLAATTRLARQESHGLAGATRLARQESHGLAATTRLARQESREAPVVAVSSAESTPEKPEEVAEPVVEESYDDDAEANDVPLDQEFNPFFFMKTLPSYDEIVQTPRPIALPERTRNTPSICLVLDLDETLVHCSVDEVENPHLQFPVNFNGVDYTVNVKKRPHMEYFLRRVSKLFEVVVFTASHKAYAEKLLNLLDPHRHLIKYRLYREDCLDVYGNYLKDLNVLGRDLSKVVLVDNSPHAFGYQVNNGIPIETWYEDESDDELLNLLPFLESLIDVDDVRPVVEKQFQIQKLIDATPDEEIV